MPRIARIVLPGCAHHITQRGNNRRDVFHCDNDRELYIALLSDYSLRFDLEVHAYCLMTNHVHIVATPRKEESLARTIGRVNWRYAQEYNRRNSGSGHLWQNRFHSCALDEKRYWLALAYVERNPVRAGLADRAWDWPWSSAAAHCGCPSSTDEAMLGLEAWASLMKPSDWKKVLRLAGARRDAEELRVRTKTGRAWAEGDFIAEWEGRLGRRLHPLAVGRPRSSD
ncbi:MAG TPA: transposase [Candidatus Brocadiia bacterium]|nr:transposase [Candidatus Brocadiia bacterium]